MQPTRIGLRNRNRLLPASHQYLKHELWTMVRDTFFDNDEAPIRHVGNQIEEDIYWTICDYSGFDVWF